jgi:hypothetical protein
MEIQQAQEKIELMKKYLLMKFHEEDWHGVMDAAADLRELVIKLKMLKHEA